MTEPTLPPASFDVALPVIERAMDFPPEVSLVALSWHPTADCVRFYVLGTPHPGKHLEPLCRRIEWEWNLAEPTIPSFAPTGPELAADIDQARGQ